MKTTTLALAGLLFLAGCDSALLRTPPPSIGPQLDSGAIQEALNGNSLVTNPEVVPPLVIYFGDQGALRGLRGNNYQDSGSWRVENDTVCGDWDNWYGTMSRCWKVHRLGEVFTFTRDESNTVVHGTLAAGNVAGL